MVGQDREDGGGRQNQSHQPARWGSHLAPQATTIPRHANLNLQWSNNKNKELVIERDTLLTERDSLCEQVEKLEKDKLFLDDEVINEHALGFEKALAKCNFLF